MKSEARITIRTPDDREVRIEFTSAGEARTVASALIRSAKVHFVRLDTWQNESIDTQAPRENAPAPYPTENGPPNRRPDVNRAASRPYDRSSWTRELFERSRNGWKIHFGPSSPDELVWVRKGEMIFERPSGDCRVKGHIFPDFASAERYILG